MCKKDQQALLTFYYFPAEYWKHIRTTNPIERTFKTVRHRAKRSKGTCPGRQLLFMVFKLIKTDEKIWRHALTARNQLPKVITYVKFTEAYEAIAHDDQAAA